MNLIAIVAPVATKKLMNVIPRNVLVVLQIIKEPLVRTDKVENFSNNLNIYQPIEFSVG